MPNITQRAIEEYTSNRQSLLPGSSYIEIFDTGYIVIDGCRGVLVCSETMVRLSLEKKVLIISGDELVITQMTGESIYICGNICSVEFI